MLKTEILAMLLALCTQAEIETCPGVLMDVKDNNAVAQAGHTADGRQFVLINVKEFGKLPKHKQTNTLVHELAHGVAYKETGKATHNHGNIFKVICKDLVAETDGTTNRACRKAV